MPLAIEDCEFAKKIFQTEYLVKSEDIYEIKNLTKNECKSKYDELMRRILNDPKTNYLVVHVFAGHGIEYSDGHQTLLTNEYDEQSKSYKRFPAEKMIRILSDHNKNSYHIGIFACCR